MNSNPIKYTDPLGLFGSLLEATLVAKEYGNARVKFAQDLGEYYIALNAEKNGPYIGGGTLTRYTGDPSHKTWWPFPVRISFRYLASSEGLLGNGTAGANGGDSSPGENENIFLGPINTTAAVLGGTIGVKTSLIDYAVPKQQQTQSLAKYMKMTNYMGKVCAGYNIGYSVYKWADYSIHGGNNISVHAKYGYDIINTTAPFFFAGTPAAPFVAAGSQTYSLVDIGTDGFWLDYSTPY